VDANFAIGTIDWQLDLDQGITDFYVDTNFAVRPFVWQLEFDHDNTDFTLTPLLSLYQSTVN